MDAVQRKNKGRALERDRPLPANGKEVCTEVYIPPIIAGVIITLLAEAIGLFAYAIVLKRKEDNDGEKK
jgi:hypothetical protein